MKNGADPTLTNKYGLSVVDKASQMPSVRDFLTKYS
jgi:hypothetical protein